MLNVGDLVDWDDEATGLPCRAKIERLTGVWAYVRFEGSQELSEVKIADLRPAEWQVRISDAPASTLIPEAVLNEAIVAMEARCPAERAFMLPPLPPAILSPPEFMEALGKAVPDDDLRVDWDGRNFTVKLHGVAMSVGFAEARDPATVAKIAQAFGHGVRLTVPTTDAQPDDDVPEDPWWLLACESLTPPPGWTPLLEESDDENTELIVPFGWAKDDDEILVEETGDGGFCIRVHAQLATLTEVAYAAHMIESQIRRKRPITVQIGSLQGWTDDPRALPERPIVYQARHGDGITDLRRSLVGSTLGNVQIGSVDDPPFGWLKDAHPDARIIGVYNMATGEHRALPGPAADAPPKTAAQWIAEANERAIDDHHADALRYAMHGIWGHHRTRPSLYSTSVYGQAPPAITREIMGECKRRFREQGFTPRIKVEAIDNASAALEELCQGVSKSVAAIAECNAIALSLGPACPDCHGTREYVGLSTREPCRTCCG